MIGLIFTLTGLAIFMVMVAVMDGWMWLCRESKDFERLLGHDTLVFPDHEEGGPHE